MPINLVCLFTIPHFKNPIVKTKLKYFLLPLTIYFMIDILGILDIFTNFYVKISLIFGPGILLCFLEIFILSSTIMEVIFEFISILSCITWISIFSNIIFDIITFLSFYFNINKIMLTSLLLSAGNTTGDLFLNGALAKAGLEVTAAFASYSG